MTDSENPVPDLSAYHGWLYKVAADLLPDNFTDSDIDDLVQEGRIAMWKACQAYDDCKGTLAPWLTNAARMRMRDVACGHGRWTGHTGRRGWVDAMGVRAPRVVSLSMLLDDAEFSELRLRLVVPLSEKRPMSITKVRAWAASR